MRLPEALRAAIDEEVAGIASADLSRAAAEMSQRYRSGASCGLTTAAERAAYLLTRLPATYAADAVVFRELAARVAGPFGSMLDLGSGPGTSMWAAAEVIPQLGRFSNLEREATLIATGKRLASRSESEAVSNSSWVPAELRGVIQGSHHDLVTMSYSLGELPDQMSAIRSAWRLADVALLIIEPGTPAGFGHVLRARDLLISLGGIIAAPCPHHNACPLAIRNDWCHFSVRLERTSEHRQLKGGELGYEDEKFSYVIATKTVANQAETRIVRHPLKHPGHVKFTLCTPDGLKQATIGKSQKAMYRSARKAEWGVAWPAPSET
jgi:ribosomal protein RSM22 (predicted rRNA methylase)